MINAEPTKPNSSATIEKIKSDSANGKNKYFWRELKSPTPKVPHLKLNKIFYQLNKFLY